MSDEPESLVLRLLQEIRADVADMKTVQAQHTDTLRQHGISLDTYSANFGDISKVMQDVKDMLRRAPSNAQLARELRALEDRINAVEGRR